MLTTVTMPTSCGLRGSVLITGSSKEKRLKKAWELLSSYGFRSDSQDPDLLLLQRDGEKKSIGIAQAKEIRGFLRERPFIKEIKAVVVEDAKLLTDDAQGSLLKILEEPPHFALIILLCDNDGSLLPTVVSRCQKMDLSRERLVGIESSRLDLRNQSYEELFEYAKEVSQRNKDEAVELLECLLGFDVSNGTSLLITGKLERAIKELKEANVALKFSLEYLFLLHKSDV